MRGMEESSDSTSAVHESLNGDAKQDVRNLAKSAIIKQDVMLSGTTVQSPVITSPPVSIHTPGLTMTPGTFADHFFMPMSLPHHSESSYPQPSSKAASNPQTTLLGQPPVAASQFILAGQMAAQNATAMPLQQLLIPVSTANGTQQLITVPVNLGSGAQPVQLLTTAGGQLIAANLASLSSLTSLSGLSGLVALNQPAASAAVTTSTTSVKSEPTPLQQTTTSLPSQLFSSGQILAMGAQLLSPSAMSVNQNQGPPNTTVHHIPKSLESAKETSAISTQSLYSMTNSLTLQSAAKQRSVVEPTFSYSSISAPPAHSVTVTAPPNTQSTTPLPSIQTLTQHSNILTQTTSNGLPANINQLLPNTVSNSSERTTVDGINLDEIKEFARQFKIRRLSLGLTQTQVGQALSATEGPAYSQSAICRFEKLDITPKSAQKIKPVLEKWMREAEERYKNGVSNLTDFIGSEPSKKRKRRTSFTPHAVEVLNEFFERNTHPSGAEMTEISDKLNYDREVIRVWFCNKRQALKNTIKRLKASENFPQETYSRELRDIYPVSTTESSAIEKASSEDNYMVNSRDSLPPISSIESVAQKSQPPSVVTS